MADLIKKIKIKKQDGTFTDYIPIGAEASNVSTEDGMSVEHKLKKKPYYFDNVADMKAATYLKNGDMAVTLGYYEINDGGGAKYYIIDTPDETKYQEKVNDLYAELIIKDNVNVKQFGAYGDGEHDDTLFIKNAIIFSKLINKLLFSPKGNNYLISESLDFSNLNVDFNNSIITTNNEIDIITTNTTIYYGLIKNIDINCNSIASCAINVIEDRKTLFENINIYNVSNVGIKFNKGYEITFNNINITGDGMSKNNVGIHSISSDSLFSNIIIIDICIGIKCEGLNWFKNIHGWILNPNLFFNSKFFKIIKGEAKIEQCYSDTYHYAFYVQTTSNLQISNSEIRYAYTLIENVNMNDTPTYAFYFIDESTKKLTVTNTLIGGITLDNLKTKLCNKNIYGNLSNNIYLFEADTSSLKSELIPNEGVTIISQDVKNIGNCVEINAKFKIDLDTISSKIDITLATVNDNLIPETDVNYMCVLSNEEWNVDKIAYLYLGVNGKLTTRADNETGIKYFKVHLRYNKKLTN